MGLFRVGLGTGVTVYLSIIRLGLLFLTLGWWSLFISLEGFCRVRFALP